jgi:hypothetical protein
MSTSDSKIDFESIEDISTTETDLEDDITTSFQLLEVDRSSSNKSAIKRDERQARAYEKFIRRRKTQEDRIKRVKQRHVEAWNGMSQEEKEQHKIDRKKRMEDMEQRLDRALIDGLNVCIDLSYDNDSQHSEKEQRSLGKQLSLSYAQVLLHKPSLVFNFQDSFLL